MPKVFRYFWCWRCRTTAIKMAGKKRHCPKGHLMRSTTSNKRFLEVQESWKKKLTAKQVYEMFLGKEEMNG